MNQGVLKQIVWQKNGKDLFERPITSLMKLIMRIQNGKIFYEMKSMLPHLQKTVKSRIRGHRLIGVKYYMYSLLVLCIFATAFIARLMEASGLHFF